MTRRALAAVVRLELLRGRTLFFWSGGVALAAIAAALLLPRVAGVPIASLAIILAMIAAMGPLGSLASDKLLGHLEFDRCLPIGVRELAFGRLLGASLRTVPVALAATAVGLAIAEGIPDALELLLILSAGLVAQVITWWLLWALLALNARFSLRRLWWVPMTLWLLPSLLPEATMDALGVWLESVGSAFLQHLDSPVRIVAAVLGGLMVPSLLIFGGSVLLFASGLTRYRPDPTALGVSLGTAPRRELAALGRGPIVAVARLRLRLALEQFRREIGIAAVLLVVIVADIGTLGHFARGYLPILALLMPGGIALQLMTGRANGALEGLQHLPQPRGQVALGHLAAIVVMALPGALLITVSRWVEGVDPTASFVIGRWLWYIVAGWGVAVIAVWATPRRLLSAVGIGLGLGALGWLLGTGPVLVDASQRIVSDWPLWQVRLGLALPGAVVLITGLAGVALFASGLKRYQPGQSMSRG